MPNIKAKDILLYKRMFDLEVKFLLTYLEDYKQIILEQCLKSDNENVIFDQDFMVEMAQDGFLHALNAYARDQNEYEKAKKDIVKQIDEILGD